MPDHSGYSVLQVAKAGTDSVVIPTAVLTWFHAVTIPDVAAFLAALYTLCRLAEWIVKVLIPWCTRRRKR